jgi:hypothetical protein
VLLHSAPKSDGYGFTPNLSYGDAENLQGEQGEREREAERRKGAEDKL